MGVYIDMEMPKDRPLIIKICPDGSVFTTHGIYGIGHCTATAFPVPPHGRLIDEDAMAYQLEKQATIDSQPRAIRRARRMVNDAATIIPAEEE